MKKGILTLATLATLSLWAKAQTDRLSKKNEASDSLQNHTAINTERHTEWACLKFWTTFSPRLITTIEEGKVKLEQINWVEFGAILNTKKTVHTLRYDWVKKEIGSTNGLAIEDRFLNPYIHWALSTKKWHDEKTLGIGIFKVLTEGNLTKWFFYDDVIYLELGFISEETWVELEGHEAHQNTIPYFCIGTEINFGEKFGVKKKKKK